MAKFQLRRGHGQNEGWRHQLVHADGGRVRRERRIRRRIGGTGGANPERLGPAGGRGPSRR
jgi:hypothetical protein